MRDVVIIGGGLSGLAAAAELENLQIPYRLIEVKGRLGGSIASERQADFVLDGGAFAFPQEADWSFLAELGLEDSLCQLEGGGLRRKVVFKDGTQTVIDALARRLQGTILYKMAVSSLGSLEGRFVLCLENGLMLDAGALIVAAPARYVERMFRTLQPEVSRHLLDYGYDTITRVSLGYRCEELTDPGRRVWGDMAIAFYHACDHPSRVPPGYVLAHLGVRFPLERATPEVLIRAVQTQLGWPIQAVMERVSYWPEADPLPPHTAQFQDQMAVLENLLPGGIALAGSDYAGLGLAARISSGRAAARKIAAWLDKKSF